MSVSIIVAMTEERVIGLNNRLPWHLSEDLKRFKQITMGHPIIMGRKTFESIGKPLPGRENIVLTRDRNFRRESVSVVHSLDEALARGAGAEKFVIGGAALFLEAWPRVDTLYLTMIHRPFAGDTYFPPFDLHKEFDIVDQRDGVSESPEKIPFTFITGKRKSNKN